jgi:hypothetical protein
MGQQCCVMGCAMLQSTSMCVGHLARASDVAGSARHKARRSLAAIVCGFSFWGAASGIAVGVAIDARHSVFAQEHVGEHDKENREKSRKEHFESAKKWYKALQRATDDLCKADNDDARKNAAHWIALDNEYLQQNIDEIIEQSDDLTEEEQKAVQDLHAARKKALEEWPIGEHDEAAMKEAAEKGKMAAQDFRSKTAERREKITERLQAGKELTLVSPTECPHFAIPSPFGQPDTVTLSAGYEGLSDWTTFTSDFDKLKTHGFANLFQIGGQANWGPAWLSGQIAFGGGALGPFSDVPTGFPGAGTSGTLNSGSLYDLDLKAGYSFWQGQGQRAGIEAGYYLLSNRTSGTITSISGFAVSGLGEMPVNNDLWQAAQGGFYYQTRFSTLGRDFMFRADLDGMPVNLWSGMLHANGGGVQSDIKLSTPIYGRLWGFLKFQYTYMNASGDIAGLHMNVTDSNLAVAAGITWSEGINFGTGIRY